MQAETYLILGATGTVGRRVFETLRQQKHAVRGASRRPENPGFVTLDLTVPTTHEPALEGVSTVMLMSRPGDEDAHVHAAPFVDAMVRQRVRRIVVLSALGAEKRPEFSLHKVEKLVERSGIDWTHVRPNFFMEMLATPPLSTEIATRSTLSLPLGDATVAYVSADDVAAVLVRALLDPSLSHQGIDVNGPQSLGHAEIVELIARKIGRPIRYVPLDEDTARRLLSARGLSPSHVDRVLRFYALTRQGWCATPDAGLSRLLGRPLRSLAEFVEALAASWTPS